MAWDKGFDVRATAGYVTDPANHTYVLVGDLYPVTRNSVTFGWLTGNPPYVPDIENVNAGLDARLAGWGYRSPGLYFTLRVDLPAPGNYLIRLACSVGGATRYQTIELFDDATSRGKLLDHLQVPQNYYADANGSLHATAAAWVTNNVAVVKTFTSTTLKLQVGPEAYDYTILTHVFVSQQGTTPSASQAFWAYVG